MKLFGGKGTGRVANILRIVTVIILAISLVFALGCGKKQETYPTKPISIIVPYGPGGTTDIQSRIVASFLEKKLGQPVSVVDKAGGYGTIGHAEVAHAKPDGYTIGCTMFPDSPILAGVKGADAGFKNEDFVMIGTFTVTPGALFIKNDAPFKTIQELVDYAKKNPEKVTVAVAGSDAWLMHVLEVEEAFGIKLNPVKFKSGGDATNALMGGHVMAVMGSSSFAVTGKDKGIIALLVTGGEKRLESLPNAPTFKELGKDISYETSKAFFVPKDTPENIRNILIEAFKSLDKDPAFVEKVKGSGEVYGAYFGADLQKKYLELCRRITDKTAKNKDAFSR